MKYPEMLLILFCSITDSIAARKRTYQISSLAPTTLSAKAVDGEKSSTSGACAQTASANSPWFVVDLDDKYVVTKVVITKNTSK